MGKLLAEVPVMGGELAFSTRNLLAHNRLNLDAWHGFQEVLWNRVGRVERLKLRYRLADKAYLVIMLDKTKDGFQGVRLSRNQAFPSMEFRADAEGRFVSRKELPPAQAGWQTFTWQGKAGEGVFGLRGSAAKCEVDDVELNGVRYDFRNHQLARPFLFALALMLLTLFPLRKPGKEGLMKTFLFHLVLAFALGVAFVFDWVYWSPRYHQLNANLFDAEPERFERWRRDATSVWDDPAAVPAAKVLQVLGAELGGHPPYRLQVQTGEERQLLTDEPHAIMHLGKLVLLLGTSQTYGEGAPRLDHSLAAHLARQRPELTFVNAAMRGSESFNLVERYEHHLKALQPDLVVVNLGTNDRDPEKLRTALQKLAELNRESNIPTLFVIEANSTEATNNLPVNTPVIRDVARSYGLQVLDLNAGLRERADEGLLWWDFVHPTALGHRLAGEWLAQELPR